MSDLQVRLPLKPFFLLFPSNKSFSLHGKGSIGATTQDSAIESYRQTGSLGTRILISSSRTPQVSLQSKRIKNYVAYYVEYNNMQSTRPHVKLHRLQLMKPAAFARYRFFYAFLGFLDEKIVLQDMGFDEVHLAPI